MVPGMKQLPYHTRLAQLGLWTLEERRHRADLLYKGLSLTPFCRYFTLSHVNNTRGHSAKVLKNHCSLDLRHFFFPERVIDRWNSLPHVIDSASINTFKNGLNIMRRDSMGFFMDWLVRLARWPHMFWGSSGTGATAPGKSPGKSIQSGLTKRRRAWRADGPLSCCPLHALTSDLSLTCRLVRWSVVWINV